MSWNMCAETVRYKIRCSLRCFLGTASDKKQIVYAEISKLKKMNIIIHNILFPLGIQTLVINHNGLNIWFRNGLFFGWVKSQI